MARLGGRGTLRLLLLESLVVVLSVLLALAVDEWREEAGLRQEVEGAVAGVVREVGQNLRELEETDSIVGDRFDRLSALEEEVARPDLALADLTGRFGGYRLPELSRAAWQRMAGSPLGNRVPADFVEDAFRLYGGLEHVSALDRDITRFLSSEAYYRPEDSRVAWRIAVGLMGAQRGVMREMIERHRAFLEEHGGV